MGAGAQAAPRGPRRALRRGIPEFHPSCVSLASEGFRVRRLRRPEAPGPKGPLTETTLESAAPLLSREQRLETAHRFRSRWRTGATTSGSSSAASRSCRGSASSSATCGRTRRSASSSGSMASSRLASPRWSRCCGTRASPRTMASSSATASTCCEATFAVLLQMRGSLLLSSKVGSAHVVS